MKLPPLEYLRPSSLAEAVAALAADEDAHALAGGQSLLPLLALRLARPSVLVDLGGLGLDGVRIEAPGAGAPAAGAPGAVALLAGAPAAVAAPSGGPGSPGGPRGRLRLGALVRQRRLELDPAIASACPLLAEAVRQVGYPATRNLGTIGGSLAHADPAAELPAVAVALGGEVVASGPGGSRTLSCAELAGGYLTTTLAPGELVVEVVLPVAGAAHGAAWCEWAPRRHDFAQAGVGVALELDAGGTCVRVFAGACSVADRPLDLGAVVQGAGLLGAGSMPAALVVAVARAVEAAAAAAGEDGAELCGLLAGRAALLAFERARTAGMEPEAARS